MVAHRNCGVMRHKLNHSSEYLKTPASKPRFMKTSRYTKWKKSLTIIFSCCFFMCVMLLGYMSCYRQIIQDAHYKLLYSMMSGASSQDICHIPNLDPWDKTILDYLKPFEPLHCKKLQPELTHLDNNGYLVVNETAKLEYKYSWIKCQYRCFSKNEGVDDITLLHKNWVDVNETRTKIDCEFIEVACSGSFSPISVYSNVHSQIVVNRSHAHNRSPPFGGPQKPNVLLFVLDSISKSNFRRFLPNLVGTLTSDYGAVVMEGFTKVGDNSFPNAAAVLTGKRVCVAGYENELPEDMSESFFDDWPLAWFNFSKAGYVTYYAEDFPNFNLFQYTSNGFRNKPVHHFFRPFWVKLWNSFLHRRSTNLCYGNNPKHLLQLNYLRQFFTKYNDSVPKFAFNWLTELGHDWLAQVALGDTDLQKFFAELKLRISNNTIIIVFSDHGHRFDAIRQSVIGRIEERMPYCSISIPAWMKQEFPHIYQNLLTNSKRLTSPYDLHATLMDILKNDFTNKQQDDHLSTRGLSLFRPIPYNRHCADAGIPDEFCICQEETIVNVSDSKVIAAAAKLIDHINDLLINVSDRCAKLELSSIKNAQNLLPNLNTVFAKKSPSFASGTASGLHVHYRVTVDVIPSGALFEGMLRYMLVDETFSVIGDVNRINKYGNQSTCVDSALLKKFCYCNF